MAKTLIAFFSRADENYFGGAMRYVKVGNTEIVAEIMKELTGADTFKIEMKDPYSPVYMTCIDEAKKDLRENARPELTSYIDSIDGYDTIILGYPNYWERYQWLLQLSSKDMISQARPSFRFAQTKAAEWDLQNAMLRSTQKALMLKRACRSQVPGRQTQKMLLRNGLLQTD